MAEFLGGSADEIAFGMNMTSLAFDISRALARDWSAEDNIVVTEIDHRANVDTWITAAEDRGTTVNWIPLDTTTLTLDYDHLDELITDNTRLVAVTHASNGVGTITDLEPIVSRANEVGAIVVLDAVHSAPHLFIDREALGVDIVLCSAYKFFGPHIGIASIRKRLFDRLQAYRITTAPKEAPGKLETGTQSFEGLAGVRGAIDFFIELGEGKTNRERIRSAFDQIHDHEGKLAAKLREYLRTQDLITLYQADASVHKTPTIAFRIAGMTPGEVVEHLNEYAIFAGAGHFYASTIAQRLQLTDGWVRIGMAPYNSVADVDRFISAIDELV